MSSDLIYSQVLKTKCSASYLNFFRTPNGFIGAGVEVFVLQTLAYSLKIMSLML